MPAAAPIAYAVLLSSLLTIASLRNELAQLPLPRHPWRLSHTHTQRPRFFYGPPSFVEQTAPGPSYGVESGPRLRGGEKVVRVFNHASFGSPDLNGDFYYDAHHQVDKIEKTDDHGAKDSVSFFTPINFDWEEPHYIVGWRPRMQMHKCKDGTLHHFVHHMNLCRGRPEDDTSDYAEIAASYDRGAEGFRLPKGYGIPIQPGEPFYLDTHYLPPRCWVYEQDKVQVKSGLDLVVTTRKPDALARLYGFTDDGMTLKPSGTAEAYEAILPRETVSRIVADGGEEVLAVHLHTHDIFDAKSFEVRGPRGELRFRSRPEPTGYGATQSFLSPGEKGWPSLRLEPGLEMRQRCRVAKNHAHTIYYGLSHGNEMCAALLIVGFSKQTEALPKAVTLSTDVGALVQLAARSLSAAIDSVAAGFRRLV